MDGIDAVDYKNGRKNNWRAALWNIIEKKARDKYKSIILYLPGENALDRREALRRNYRQHCLIAVERNSQICDALRADGQLCINADLGDVMRSWPIDVPVDFVIADLQCNFCSDVILLIYSWAFHPAFSNSAMLLNLQRGMETGLNAEAMRFTRDRFQKEHLMRGTPLGGIGQSDNNRFLISYTQFIYRMYVNRRTDLFRSHAHSATETELCKIAGQEACNLISALMPMIFRSYISARVTMDSGILWHVKPIKFNDAEGWPTNLKAKRSITAVLATRTRQMRERGIAV